MNVTDQQLIALIAGKDRVAFSELYRRFAPRVFGLVLKLARDRTEAEDILQEVFLHVWKNAGRYDPRLSQPIVWLMLIARGRTIDAMRRRSSQAELVQRAPPPTGLYNDGATSNGSHEQSWRVHTVLASLPAEQSDAIGLAFQGGLTAAQIAALRGAPVGTVKTRIRLGMIRLRETLNGVSLTHGARTPRTSSEVVL